MAETSESKPYIFINPDGGAEYGLIVIVAAHTGITYATQCDGTNCSIREIEGFAVPLGSPSRNEYARLLVEFFERNHCAGGAVSEENIPELQDIVREIPFWKTSSKPNDDQKFYLELDISQTMEIVEAWIPVETIYGKGILTFENCD